MTSTASLTDAVVLRRARAADAPALERLATLDSSTPIPGPHLVAEADGELRAAVSLADGSAIADPFHPTAAYVDLLRRRAEAAPARRRLQRRLGLPRGPRVAAA